MQTINIEKRICLDSKYLDNKIMVHLLNQLKEITNDKCTQEYGYILKINKINKIISHEIGRANTDNIFNINFEADVLKPEKGMKTNGKVCMIYKDGIFIDILDKQKMLIPKTQLTNYTFNNDMKNYVDTKGNHININDEINVMIIAVSYNGKKYSCFGSII